MNAYTIFIQECRQAIADLDMTFDDVAKALNVSRPRISQYLTSEDDERGMSLRIAMTLADLLGVSIDDCIMEERHGTDT